MPDKTQINLALIGCGGMAHAHGDWLNEMPEANVVALCDINRENLDKLWKNRFASRESIRKYDSIDALLADPPEDLDAVIIMTPHTLHFPQAMAALDAGYPVLVEKPMVTRSDHARQLAEKVRETGLLLQVGFQAPYSAEFAYIRDVLRKGGLGELQTITAWSHQNWKNFGAGTWRHDPAQSGGGQMYDTGAHLFNAIAWMIDRPVEQLFCWLDKKEMPIDINAVMTIRWEGNVFGTATISGNSPGWDEGIILAGTQGRIHTGIHGGKLEHYDAKGKLIKYPSVPFPHRLARPELRADLVRQSRADVPGAVRHPAQLADGCAVRKREQGVAGNADEAAVGGVKPASGGPFIQASGRFRSVRCSARRPGNVRKLPYFPSRLRGADVQLFEWPPASLPRPSLEIVRSNNPLDSPGRQCSVAMIRIAR